MVKRPESPDVASQIVDRKVGEGDSMQQAKDNTTNFNRKNAKALSRPEVRKEKYKGKWIAIDEGEVIASGTSELEVYQEADSETDSDNFLITKIPEESKARVI